jgi:hypothetical protein
MHRTLASHSGSRIYATAATVVGNYILVVGVQIMHVSKGTKLHFKLLTAERRLVLCIGVGRDKIHASSSKQAKYTPLDQLSGCHWGHMFQVRKKQLVS